jgi:hypothetical protein
MARSLICAEMPMAAALDRLFPVQFARLTLAGSGQGGR